MWSNLYWYFNIRSDKSPGNSLPSSDIVNVLKKQQELKQTGPQSFTNDKDFPWIDISCVYSKNGNYSHNLSDLTETSDLIVVVTSKGNDSDDDKVIHLLTEIANKLDWELILEEDNDGNEDVVINK